RGDGSLADGFAGGRRRAAALSAGPAGVLVWFLAGVAGVVALLLAAVTAVVYGRWWQRRFGGLTGDGAGAAGLGTETLALCVLAGSL
ncbi:MAG: adenosylcobinamide-GDP ribazoletransferase, partial [Actinomycetota bacterium]|nr:adenosylcobinamide-GDP ribazoletransferase [Actinomycetota bacterium]